MSNDYRSDLMRAVVSCPHEITADEVVLRYDPKQAGKNAFDQLMTRIEAAPPQPSGWRDIAPDGWKLVPRDRSYDMRAKAIIAFNTAEQAGKDRDDALDAAFQAMLAAAPAHPAEQQQGGSIHAVTEDQEQAAFEVWLARECPSGDVESVQRQWEESSDYTDLYAGQQEGGDAAEKAPPRYVVLKASGSRYAYVNDTQEGKTVKRYDVLKGDGWEQAEKHAERLNRAAMTGGKGNA